MNPPRGFGCGSSRPRRFSTSDERWEAVVRRDRSADEAFVYAVLTTGIYCRPSCGARMPRRENIRFFGTCAAAERAGYRACKRCRPNEESIGARHAAAIEAACLLIENSGAVPSLDVLARRAGMSRFHFHRVFKTIVGVTPKAYANKVRRPRRRN
jgi:AraC family transcriptional regulator, regulatory protein of adaptative response / methylated-DNA-[protein]-cysteine methyltransferase